MTVFGIPGPNGLHARRVVERESSFNAENVISHLVFHMALIALDWTLFSKTVEPARVQ
ncbi:hypothetical protein ACJMK2_015695, partial [Sinanodonta woodiana]